MLNCSRRTHPSNHFEPSNPAADRSYDAGAIVGLAIAIAGSEDPAKIKDAMYKAVDPAGTPIFAGKARPGP